MFSSGLVNNLDNLAREGIIDFDAAAFVTGVNPRYIGNPSWTQPLPDLSGVNTNNLKQPSKDEMIYANPENNRIISKNPLWKKMLFGAIATGLLIFGGSKLLKTNLFKNLAKKFHGFLQTFGKNAGNGKAAAKT